MGKEDIAENLKDINETLEKILKVLDKPESKFDKVLERVVLVVGVFGIITIADVIIEWVMGG